METLLYVYIVCYVILFLCFLKAVKKIDAQKKTIYNLEVDKEELKEKIKLFYSQKVSLKNDCEQLKNEITELEKEKIELKNIAALSAERGLLNSRLENEIKEIKSSRDKIYRKNQRDITTYKKKYFTLKLALKCNFWKNKPIMTLIQEDFRKLYAEKFDTLREIDKKVEKWE